MALHRPLGWPDRVRACRDRGRGIFPARNCHSMDRRAPQRLCAGVRRMLESLVNRTSLTTTRFPALGRFTRSRLPPARSRFGCRARSFRDGALLELSRRLTSCFFASVNGVAEHFGYRSGSAKEMNLETMRLFTRFGLRIDSSDV